MLTGSLGYGACCSGS